MPTGYTFEVSEGTITDLEPFIMQLARGMGALVMMRDAPRDAPIPDQFEPSQYHAEKLADARRERDRLRGMSASEAQREADAEFASFERDRAAWYEKQAAMRERYEAMIEKVEAWEGAPEGIKEFALSQLRESLDFDCPEGREYYSSGPIRDGQQWLAEAIASAEKDILHHSREQAAENARTEGRNAWLRQLRASLEKGSDHDN